MFERPLYLNRLRKYRDTEFIKVITGVRRSGKTFLLQMLKNDLLKSGIAPNQIIDINFESMKYSKLTEKEPFYNYVMQRAVSGKKMYLFFDEVQRVNQWQDAVNSFRVDLDADIYISGSNASLLSGELATLLTEEWLKFRSIHCRLKNIYYLNNQQITLILNFIATSMKADFLQQF